MNWVEMNVAFQKDLIFNIMRMQKPIYLSMGKFYPKNLRIYVGVMLILFYASFVWYCLYFVVDYEDFLFVLYAFIKNNNALS